MKRFFPTLFAIAFLFSGLTPLENHGCEAARFGQSEMAGPGEDGHHGDHGEQGTGHECTCIGPSCCPSFVGPAIGAESTQSAFAKNPLAASVSAGESDFVRAHQKLLLPFAQAPPS